MKQSIFGPCELLLPKGDFSRFAVIACDQFTSQKEYWDKVEATVGDAPSALRLILPEIYLNDRKEERIATINQTMKQYLFSDVFARYPGAMVLVERTLPSGKVRRGIVGVIDLEAYDFHPGTTAPIRATEGTVLDRIPPRVAIRKDAPIELPHVLLLIDDPQRTVIEPIADKKNLPPLYDFELMLGGGHLKGSLLDADAIAEVDSALAAIYREGEMLFAVGDGNHSLATAKTCYLANPTPENRYALVEIENIHDEALEFEPIYRAVFGVDEKSFVSDFSAYLQARGGDGAVQSFTVCAGDKELTLTCPHPESALPVGTVQSFLDSYLAAHKEVEVEVDYIHGIEATRTLAKEKHTVGILFDGMQKGELFEAVTKDGALPRKTFSMGEAESKRYYVEARVIKN